MMGKREHYRKLMKGIIFLFFSLLFQNKYLILHPNSNQ